MKGEGSRVVFFAALAVLILVRPDRLWGVKQMGFYLSQTVYTNIRIIVSLVRYTQRLYSGLCEFALIMLGYVRKCLGGAPSNCTA